MLAMALNGRGRLQPQERPPLRAGPGQIRLRVEACGVCRTDLHVVDGDLPLPLPQVVPGHEVVGRVVDRGPGATRFRPGQRVGIPWLGGTCGTCPYCAAGAENLCDVPQFTGLTRDGGFAQDCVANEAYVVPLPEDADSAGLAPLLCAGLIGYRAYRMAGPGRRLGLYGFGAAAHLLAQLAVRQGREVYAFTRPGDISAQDLARELGAVWAGGSDLPAPEPLDTAILFAPVGALVPVALRAVRKGGSVVCAGIHMTEIPAFPYAALWGERVLRSVANLTRADAQAFLALEPHRWMTVRTRRYPLAAANAALDDLREGRIAGAAVLVP